MLRSAYIVSSISHCSRALRIAWKDGVESVYPSTWLRASVRDSRFFNPNALMYEPSHISFISREDATLKDAILTKSRKLLKKITVPSLVLYQVPDLFLCPKCAFLLRRLWSGCHYGTFTCFKHCTTASYVDIRIICDSLIDILSLVGRESQIWI